MRTIARAGRSGFTLIELMIVVSIIGLLASIAIPKMADMVRKAQEGQTKGSLGALRSALSIYYADMEGQYPYIGLSGPIEALTINGKYLSAVPLARSPYYHTATSATFSCGSALSPNIDTAVSACEGNFVLGDWGATMGMLTDGWLVVTWSASGAAIGNQDIFVNCTHTDSRGTAWTSY